MELQNWILRGEFFISSEYTHMKENANNDDMQLLRSCLPTLARFLIFKKHSGVIRVLTWLCWLVAVISNVRVRLAQRKCLIRLGNLHVFGSFMEKLCTLDTSTIIIVLRIQNRKKVIDPLQNFSCKWKGAMWGGCCCFKDLDWVIHDSFKDHIFFLLLLFPCSCSCRWGRSLLWPNTVDLRVFEMGACFRCSFSS